MQIIHSLNNPDNLPLALTIGNFDGVHIGHQAILNTLVQTAKQQQYRPAVMTFTPHAKVFFGNTTNFLISSDEEKADWMAQHGVATLLQIPFNYAFSETDAIDFIDLLIRGNFELLSRICTAHHISLQHTPTILYDGKRVSSSRVRQAIKAADFNLVEHLLGRRLQYNGKVIRGKQLGRTIAFPTANICLPQTRLLPDGVFAVRVYIEGRSTCYYGMCNIGTKPTVDNSQKRQIETHIFDFSDNLYDKTITLEPVAKIRDEVKFNGLDTLIKQLHF